MVQDKLDRARPPAPTRSVRALPAIPQAKPQKYASEPCLTSVMARGAVPAATEDFARWRFHQLPAEAQPLHSLPIPPMVREMAPLKAPPMPDPCDQPRQRLAAIDAALIGRADKVSPLQHGLEAESIRLGSTSDSYPSRKAQGPALALDRSLRHSETLPAMELTASQYNVKFSLPDVSHAANSIAATNCTEGVPAHKVSLTSVPHELSSSSAFDVRASTSIRSVSVTGGTTTKFYSPDEVATNIDPVTKLRLYLKMRFGTLRRAFKSLDVNGHGALSFDSFKLGLEQHDVNWSEVTGCSDLRKLFKALDVQENGELNSTQMMGVSHENGDTENEWQFMNTMEKWSRWCSNTELTSTKRSHTSTGWVQPLQKAKNDINVLRCDHEEKRTRDRTRMQKLMKQGVHRTGKAGFEQTVRHLPKDITREGYNVQKYRHNALESICTAGLRIKQAIHDAAAQRQELKHCVEEMQAIEPKKHDQLQEFAACMKSSLHPSKSSCMKLTCEMVNMFTEDELPLEEQHMRQLARSSRMPIPDAETVMAQFNIFCKQSGGVTRKHFPKMLQSLTGEGRSDAKLKELWRTIDRDRNGLISFDEYLIWHHANCHGPRLGRPQHLLTPGSTPSSTPRHTERLLPKA